LLVPKSEPNRGSRTNCPSDRGNEAEQIGAWSTAATSMGRAVIRPRSGRRIPDRGSNNKRPRGWEVRGQVGASFGRAQLPPLSQ